MQQLYLPLEFGRQFIRRPTNPAADTDFSVGAENSFVEALVSVMFTFVTAGGGSTRSVAIEIADATGVIQVIGTNQTQSGGQTLRYMCIQNIGLFEANSMDLDTSFFFMPQNLVIPRGGTVASQISGTSATDQISDIVVVTRTWARP